MTDQLTWWKKGVVGALAWATAITTAHLGHGMGLILLLGQPPHTAFALRGVLSELVLGGVVSLLLAPVHRLARGGFPVQIGGLALIWLVMERMVMVDPSKPLMWLGPTIAALVLLGIGAVVARSSVRAAVGAAVLLPLALLLAPEVRSALLDDAPPKPVLKPARAGAPDVLFIVMDTTRAQSSSAYGYHRQTTPVLEQLASEGVLFEQASAPATWSLPAHAALFTGTFPSFNDAHAETRKLGSTLPTIGEVFADAGYETWCFSANPHISDAFGLTRGFHHQDKAWKAGPSARQFSFPFRMIDLLGFGESDKGGAFVVDNIASWWDDRPEDSAPAFVFVNFLEAHFPFHQLPRDYVRSYQDRPMSELRQVGQISFGAQFGRPLTQAEVDRIAAPMVDLYDGGVRYTDALVGQVIDEWRDRGLLDNTVVVVLGDHGEMMGEHNAFGHVTSMYEEDLRVPLIFRYPPGLPAGRRVPDPVSTVGTMATLAELAGVPLPALPTPSGTPHVTSLLPALDGADAGQPVIAERYEEHLLSARFGPGEANGDGPLVDPRGRYRSFRLGSLKMVEHFVPAQNGANEHHSNHLYDLSEDPGELHDLAQTPEGSEMMRALQATLNAHMIGLQLKSLGADVDPANVADVADNDPETTRALCELGYLTGAKCD